MIYWPWLVWDWTVQHTGSVLYLVRGISGWASSTPSTATTLRHDDRNQHQRYRSTSNIPPNCAGHTTQASDVYNESRTRHLSQIIMGKKEKRGQQGSEMQVIGIDGDVMAVCHGSHGVDSLISDKIPVGIQPISQSGENRQRATATTHATLRGISSICVL